MQDEEPGLSIKDILAYCFLHWRSAVAVVLVGAVLGGAYFVRKAQNVVTPSMIQEAEETAAAADVLQQALDTQENNVSRLGIYLQESLLMEIDPSNECVSSANLAIRVDGQDANQALSLILSAYRTRLIGSPALDTTAQELGTRSAYLRELISITSSIGEATAGARLGTDEDDVDITAVVVQQESGASYAAGTLSLKVIAPDADTAIAIRGTLLEEAQAIQAELAAQIAPFTLTTTALSDYTAIDSELMELQVKRAYAVSDAQINYTNNSNNAVIDANAAAVEASGSSLLKALIKGGVLGGVGAFLLYGFVLCLRYVFDGSPEVRGQIEARYALPELGSYAYAKQAYYKGQTGFDQWLRKLAGIKNASDSDALAEMIAANVRLYAGDAQSLVVTSSVSSDKASELAEQLRAQLNNTKVILANDLISSSDARGQLKAADAVLFVEEYGVSSFESIDDEVTLAVETGKLPLGLVMA